MEKVRNADNHYAAVGSGRCRVTNVNLTNIHDAFSRRFGGLEIHISTEFLPPDGAEILVLSNREENGGHIGMVEARHPPHASHDRGR